MRLCSKAHIFVFLIQLSLLTSLGFGSAVPKSNDWSRWTACGTVGAVAEGAVYPDGFWITDSSEEELVRLALAVPTPTYVIASRSSAKIVPDNAPVTTLVDTKEDLETFVTKMSSQIAAANHDEVRLIAIGGGDVS